MATTSYHIRKGKNKYSINLLFSISSEVQIRRSTGLKIALKDWDKRKSYPKKNY